MRIRPVDACGDMQPVLRISDMTHGAEAVALLVKDRLSLLYGEWWENTNLGFQVLKQMKESRLSAADANPFASMITEYIRRIEGVSDVQDVAYAVTENHFSYSCTVLTESGMATVSYETDH